MGFFSDKKKGSESLKTLSEKDIQSRLYGHLRTNDRVVQEDLPSLSKPRVEPQTTFKSSETLKTSPSLSVKTASPELFKTQETRTEAASAELRPAVAPKIYTDRYAKPPAEPKTSWTQGVGASLLQGLKTVGFKFAEILSVLIAGIFSAFASLDFRKPAVRRFAYGLLTVTALACVFIGIHHLNKNREAAMKAPRKIKKAAAAHPSQPLESALSSVKAETSAASGQIKAVNPVSGETAKKSQTSQDKSVKKEAAAEKKPFAPAVSAAEPKKSSEPVQSYVIQVATFAAQEDASRLVEKFKTSGFASFFKSVARSGGRVYYCVYIGKFETRQAAENKLTEFKKQEVARPFQDAFVR